MKYGSVCSGVEAASVAWEPLGFEPVFFSEIEPFPSAVLAHHWPHVPNHGDMTRFEEWGHQDIDILVGGTPCQSFSVAGLRKGLTDDRGNLSLTYMRMVDKLRPRWTVWENVFGVLSANSGRDFGAIVGALDELGYSCAWRVLDAQNFGVPQRRRRVFLVGCASGDWRDPASVLFESNCGGRDFEQGREARKANTGGASQCFANNVAPTITSSGPPYSRTGNQGSEVDALVVHGSQDPIVSDKAFPLGRNQGQENVVGGVRRLTPTEAERLQGFPDGHTDIGWKGKATPDSHRYKAMGNSMAVPVMRWIGERIQKREGGEL